MAAIEQNTLIELTAEIVSAYVAKNRLPAAGLSDLIASISVSVSKLGEAAPAQEAAPTPAVNPRKSVHADYIICLEDGKKFKSMKRHLGMLGLTPEAYRAKWGLAADYPMVAPNYAAARSEMAKKIGLGRKPEPKPKPTPKARRAAKAK